jgi:hypothetical protein
VNLIDALVLHTCGWVRLVPGMEYIAQAIEDSQQGLVFQLG